MARIITFAVTVGISLVVAAPGLGKGQPVTNPATEAQILRGEALGRYYQRTAIDVDPATQAQILRGRALGRHFQRVAVQVDPATEAQILRGLALDRHFGLGRFAVDPATEAQILRGQALGSHYQRSSSSTSVQPAGRSLVFDDHRTDAAQQSTGRTLVFDNHRLDATRPEQVPVTSSGREIEWPQVGLGLGLGIALAFGMFLTFRYTRARPLAH